MTRTEFQANERNCAELSELLRQPVMQMAIGVLRSEMATNLPDPTPGVDYGAQAAALGAYAVGWNRALKSLESLPLAIRNTTGQPLLPREQFRDAALARMKKSGLYTDTDMKDIT